MWETRFKDEMQTLRLTAHHLSNAKFVAQYSALENQLRSKKGGLPITGKKSASFWPKTLSDLFP